MPHPYSSPSPQANQPLTGPIPSVASVEHVNDRERSFTPVADNNTRPCVTLSSRIGVDVLYRLDCELATHERSRLTTKSTVIQMFVKVEPIDPEDA